jgi:uncharacterized membrane protein YdfJ with MMPL/SSD domain
MYEQLGSFVSRYWALVILAWVLGGLALSPVVQRSVGIHFTPTWDEVTEDGDLAYLPARMTSVRGQQLYGEAFKENKSRAEIVVVLERETGLEQTDLDLAQQIANFFDEERKAWDALPPEDRLHRTKEQMERLAAVEVKRPASSFEGSNAAEELVGKKLISKDKKAVIVVCSLEHEFIAVDSAFVINKLAGADESASLPKRIGSGLGLLPPEAGKKSHRPGMVEKLMAKFNEDAARLGTTPLSPGLNWEVTGSAAVGGDTLIESDRSIKNIHLATGILVLLILLAVYRAPIVVFVPLLTIGVAVVISRHVVALLTQLDTVPGFGWFHFEIFKTSEIFIFTILFGCGTDFCLFLISRYREELENGLDKYEAMREALGQVGEALTGSAFTTIFGLGMMYFADFGKFTYSGPAIALCLFVALMACLTFAPALMCACGAVVFWPFGVKKHDVAVDDVTAPVPDKTLIGRFWTWTSDRIMARPGTILVCSLVVMAPFAAMGWNVKVNYNLLADLPNYPRDPDETARSVKGTQMLQNHFPAGETGPITVLVKKDGVDLNLDEWRDEITALTKGLYLPHTITLEAAIGGKDIKQIAEVRYLVQENNPDEDQNHVAAGQEIAEITTKDGQTIVVKSPYAGRIWGFLPPKQLKNPSESIEPAKDGKPKVPVLAHVNNEITGVRSLMYPLGDVPVHLTLSEKVKLATLQKKSEVVKTYLAQSGERAGQVTRFDVIQVHDPFSEEAEAVLEQLKTYTDDLAKDPASKWYQATFDFVGTTSGTHDLKLIITSDERLIQLLVVIAVFGVILTILRRPLICLYLMFTVVFSYLATIGATEAVFELWYEARGLPFTGLDWKVPIFLFVILVAVGEDYNIYLATRVFEEERRWGRIQGLRAAIIKTGGIITSCGVIMAGTFISLMSGSLVAMLALGFALTLGVILDTFIVRPILVPAFLAWLYRIMPEPETESPKASAVEEEPQPLGALIGEPMTMPAAPHTEMARRTVNR